MVVPDKYLQESESLTPVFSVQRKAAFHKAHDEFPSAGFEYAHRHEKAIESAYDHMWAMLLFAHQSMIQKNTILPCINWMDVATVAE